MKNVLCLDISKKFRNYTSNYTSNYTLFKNITKLKLVLNK